MPVKKIRDTVGVNGATRPGSGVRWDQVPVSPSHLGPVIAHETNIHCGLGAP